MTDDPGDARDTAAASTRSVARVGVRDVARAAGVSPQTVSRVLNGRDHIRAETRQRVLDAMTALDYRVNNAARALGTSETRTIGVIASDAALHGPSAGIAAVEAAAREAGRWIATTYADAGDEASVAAALDHVRGQGVDGIVLIAPHATTPAVVARRAAGLPVAVLHGGAGSAPQRRGAALLTEHLIGLGHVVVARLGGPADWLEEEARAAGFLDALAVHGLDPAASFAGDWSAASGAAAADALAPLLVQPDGPTAVVVANDQMALGLIAGLRSRGVHVPRDVSVTGFDDAPDAAFYRPALTTVRLDLVAEARRCVRAIIAPDPVERDATGVAPMLVPRASTAAPSR